MKTLLMIIAALTILSTCAYAGWLGNYAEQSNQPPQTVNCTPLYSGGMSCSQS